MAGLVDDLTTAGIKCFGPKQAAAQFEGSKGFTKDLCAEFAYSNGGLWPLHGCCERQSVLSWGKAADRRQGRRSRRRQGRDYRHDARRGRGGDRRVLCRRFRQGGQRGRHRGVPRRARRRASSRSSTASTRSPSYPAQDHKRVGDGDTGPNTGGMGAYSPAAVMTAEMTERTMREIIEPTVAAMASARHALQGRAVRRPDDHRRRPQAHRIQRALRRPRDAGADDAPEVGSAAGAARLCRRGARSVRCTLAR